MIRLFLTITLFLFISVYSFGQVDKAEAEIEDIMKRSDVVGLSVAVVQKGNLIYSRSFGLKDKVKNTPLTNTDIFRIASISKSFSATAIMQLVEAGKVSLDDDFSKLVGFEVRNPKYPEMPITLRMVLSHRSSINDSQGYFNFDVINPERNSGWAKCYNDYEPGKGYQYCNLNFNMVGAVIEKLSGERFDDYMKRHILNPLGLYGGFNIDSLDSTRFVTLYEYDSKTKEFTASNAYPSRAREIENYQMGYTTPVFSPTGGMKISAPDLAKYMTMLMNGGKYKGVKIMSKKHARLMQTKISDEEGYGMAIMNYEDLIPGKVMTGHTGTAYGLYSSMFFNPKEKFGIVVITNGCDPAITNGINNVLRASINSLYNNLIK